MHTFLIRPERPGDAPAIDALTRLAFAHHPHSQQTEHLITAALRTAGALSVSLVAEHDGVVIGHAAFSPVQLSSAAPHWHGLGPVAVTPAWQGRGVGSALIRSGLEALCAQGAAGCVVLGEPAYYGRFGFQAQADCVLPGVPAPFFQALTLAGPPAQGWVTYHPAFAATA